MMATWHGMRETSQCLPQVFLSAQEFSYSERGSPNHDVFIVSFTDPIHRHGVRIVGSGV